MNLVAHNHYYRVPGYRDLTPAQEQELINNHYNRVTDTCIPEEEAFRRLEKHLVEVWDKAKAEGKRYLPYEFIYQMIRSGVLEQYYEIDPKDSWVVAACEKNIPIICPAWEDCTTGNIFTAHVIRGEYDPHMVIQGVEVMMFLVDWYKKNSQGAGVGFFQIGGGTAGDFPICCVPMMEQDLGWTGTPLWAYFCQIQTPPLPMVLTPALSPTRKSPGASWHRIRPSSS